MAPKLSKGTDKTRGWEYSRQQAESLHWLFSPVWRGLLASYPPMTWYCGIRRKKALSDSLQMLSATDILYMYFVHDFGLPPQFPLRSPSHSSFQQKRLLNHCYTGVFSFNTYFSWSCLSVFGSYVCMCVHAEMTPNQNEKNDKGIWEIQTVNICSLKKFYENSYQVQHSKIHTNYIFWS